jgi:hypothetical protein
MIMGCPYRDHCRDEDCETCTPDHMADVLADLIEAAMDREEYRKLGKMSSV